MSTSVLHFFVLILFKLWLKSYYLTLISEFTIRYLVIMNPTVKVRTYILSNSTVKIGLSASLTNLSYFSNFSILTYVSRTNRIF